MKKKPFFDSYVQSNIQSPSKLTTQLHL